MKNKIILCFALTLSSFSAFPQDSNIIDCEYNTITEILQKMKTNSNFITQNPFHNDACVPFILNVNEKLDLEEKDFDNKSAYKIYEDFRQSTGTEVSNSYNPATGKFYQFFKFNEDDIIFEAMKKNWTKGNKKFALHFDEFIRLHEVSHLDRSYKDLRVRELETLADVSAVIMVSFNHDFTVKETIEFLEKVRNIRKEAAKNGYNDQFRTNNKYAESYDQKLFNSVINDLKNFPKNEFNLKLALSKEFINIKDDQIVSYIRGKHIKNK